MPPSSYGEATWPGPNSQVCLSVARANIKKQQAHKTHTANKNSSSSQPRPPFDSTDSIATSPTTRLLNTRSANSQPEQTHQPSAQACELAQNRKPYSNDNKQQSKQLLYQQQSAR